MSNRPTHRSVNAVAIAAYRRTAFAKRGGPLASMSAVSLAAAAARALLDDAPEIAKHIGVVVYGTSRLAGQGPNPSRSFALQSGLPNHIPAHTITSACLSGVDALADARRRILCGEALAVLVGSGESMSNTPRAMFPVSDDKNAFRYDDLHLRDGLLCPQTGLIMAEIAEALAVKQGIRREHCDDYAIQSHTRANLNYALHKRSIVPINIADKVIEYDQSLRSKSELHKVPSLKPLYGDGGVLTPATASSTSDGGAAMIVCHPDLASNLPRLGACVVAAGDPIDACIMPVKALQMLATACGISLQKFDMIEINEGFAPQVIACASMLDLGFDRVNEFGGALALGHPTGVSGLRLVGLAYEAIKAQLASNCAVALPVSGGLGGAYHIFRGD